VAVTEAKPKSRRGKVSNDGCGGDSRSGEKDSGCGDDGGGGAGRRGRGLAGGAASAAWVSSAIGTNHANPVPATPAQIPVCYN